MVHPSTSATPLDVDALIGAYESQAEWIRFADAKAGAVLTANGALIGVLVPTLDEMLKALRQPNGWVAAVAVALFLIWLLLAVFSAVRAFRCITPFRQQGRHPADEACPHFHSVGIANCYRINELDRFVKDAQEAGTEGFRNQILAATLIDAHISTTKYRHVSASIRLLGTSAGFAVFYLLAIQVSAYYAG